MFYLLTALNLMHLYAKNLQNRDYGKLGDGDLNYGAGLGLYSPYFSVSLYVIHITQEYTE